MRDRRTQFPHLKRFRQLDVVGGKLLFAPVGADDRETAASSRDGRPDKVTMSRRDIAR